MTAALVFFWMLVRAALAPATLFGMVLDILFCRWTAREAVLWMEENEWFPLSIVFYLIAFVGWLEFVK